MAIQEKGVAIIQEGTAWGLEFALTDKDGVPETPSEIKYAIHDEASNTKLDNGTITPSDTFEVALVRAVNTLQSTSADSETRVLTIYCEYADATDTLIIVTRWKVKKSKFLADAMA